MRGHHLHLSLSADSQAPITTPPHPTKSFDPMLWLSHEALPRLRMDAESSSMPAAPEIAAPLMQGMPDFGEWHVGMKPKRQAIRGEWVLRGPSRAQCRCRARLLSQT